LVNDPSRGIAIIQTTSSPGARHRAPGFNPSRGIAIIQTRPVDAPRRVIAVSIPHAG